MWDYGRADFVGLRDYLSNVNWNERLGEFRDIEFVASEWPKVILKAATLFIPNKYVTIRPNDKPWYSNELRRYRRSVDRLHSLAKEHTDEYSWARYRHSRNEYIQMCRDAKTLYETKRLHQLSQSSFSTKECWRLYKSVLGLTSESSYPSIFDGNKVIADDAGKAESFNNVFVEKSRIAGINRELPNVIIPTDIPVLENIDITEQDVAGQLSSLNISKSYGPDGLGPRLLKELKPVIVETLQKMFQASLRQEIVPQAWKQATVVPLHKKGDRCDINNYRPVSLLNTSGKLMEKIVFKYIYNFFRDHYIISIWQSGFIPGCWTVCQLIEIYNTFCKAVSDGKEIRVVFLDISRAFDRVWHRGLLKKLESIGVRGPLLKWIEHYLKDRQQRVCINGQFSDWSYILSGVPQGSVLGPLLFLIFINDLTHVIDHTNMRLFADDTCLFITVDNRITASNDINDDLRAIQNWSDEWLVTFSAPKTKSMVVSRKRDAHLNPPLSFDNSVVDEVSNHKHLGIVLSNDLGWANHIDEICTKAMRRLDVIQSFKFKLDRNALERFYMSFVLPIMEYGDVVWAGSPDCDLEKLDKVHIRAMRIITGATERSNINSMYEDLGWVSLSRRRLIHRLTLFYKITNNMTPQYLADIVPPTVGDRQIYNLRSRDNITQIHAQKQRYTKSFFPATIREWNSLPMEIRNSPTLCTFKTRLLKHFPPPVKHIWFNTGNRFLNIHHTRIRLGCSKLKSDLHFNLFVEDDPFCTYDRVIEDAYHYFFICPNYNDQRLVLLNAVSQITEPRLSYLLRGNYELSVNDNDKLFNHVQTFIQETTRFI